MLFYVIVINKYYDIYNTIVWSYGPVTDSTLLVIFCFDVRSSVGPGLGLKWWGERE